MSCAGSGIVGMAGGIPCCALTCGVGTCGVMEGGMH
jgi:hypothetical protein